MGPCINIYRRGRKQNADRRGQGADRVRPRPILVVFLRHNEKSQFFTHLKNLKGKEVWKEVYFNDRTPGNRKERSSIAGGLH